MAVHRRKQHCEKGNWKKEYTYRQANRSVLINKLIDKKLSVCLRSCLIVKSRYFISKQIDKG
jgi:hypothetical protein